MRALGEGRKEGRKGGGGKDKKEGEHRRKCVHWGKVGGKEGRKEGGEGEDKKEGEHRRKEEEDRTVTEQALISRGN